VERGITMMNKLKQWPISYLLRDTLRYLANGGITRIDDVEDGKTLAQLKRRLRAFDARKRRWSLNKMADLGMAAKPPDERGEDNG